MRQSLLIGFLVSFFLGGIIGAKVAGPDVEFVKVPVTKVIHDPAPPPKRIFVLPAACRSELQIAGQINRAATVLDNKGTKQLDIINQARETLGDAAKLAPVEQQQRALQGQTVGAIADLSELIIQFKKNRKACDSVIRHSVTGQ